MICILSNFYNRVLSQMGPRKRRAPRATVSPVLVMVFLMMMITPALGQQLPPLPPPPPPRMPKDLPMQSTLYDAEQLARTGRFSLNELQGELDLRGITLSDEGMVHIEIVGPSGSKGVSNAFVESFGGGVENRWRHRADAWIPVHELTNMARALSQGYYVENANLLVPTDVPGEGPGVVNSDSYRDGGADGSGMTIAVADLGFEGLTAAWVNGDIPQVYTWINYTADPFESGGVHGTGCVEAAYDHCPGATWRLYKLSSLSDLGSAIDDAIANGVDVFSNSLAKLAGGWDDNSGDACAAANWAAQNGILFFTSAGNYAQCHWQGFYHEGIGSADWHDWITGDEKLNIVVDNNEQVLFAMQWNTAGGTYDYDLYLYDIGMNVLASSTNGGNTYEAFTWTNTTGVPQTVYLAVLRYDGGITEFEVFTHYGDWQEYIIPWSSTTSPSNSTHSNVISVGAVDWSDYGTPGGITGILADYSSHGPSNSGMILPDICGPTNTTSFTYPNGMGGTSSSAPNNAGAFCAFWSADPLLDASSIRWLMEEQAILWKDWGMSGPDNFYGHGGAILVDYVPNTLWIARSAGNTSDARGAPFYTVQAAHDWAISGGRLLIFPGGNYPEPAILNKALAVETVEYSAILGQ